MNHLFDKENFYRNISIVKIILGLVTTVLTYTTINVKEDPAIGISLGFIGFFILLWGATFFLFWGVLYLINNEDSDSLRIKKDSYKSSLLFGMYLIINILLIILLRWSSLLGIIILAIFIILHLILFKLKPDAN